MNRSFLRASSVGALSVGALFAMGLAFPTAGHADVFTITADNLGVNCSGPGGCGTLTVTSVGTTYTFVVDLTAASGLVLHTTGSAMGPATIDFNLANTTTGSGATGPVTQPRAVGNVDGFGSFQFGVNCTVTTSPAGQPGNQCVPSGVSPASEFTFTVTAPAGEHLTANASGFFAAFDVAQATAGGATGFAAAVPGPVVGAGLPGLVLACGGLLGLARRRRQKFA